MRTAFIQQLILEARCNPWIFLVVGDLGFSVVEPFAQEYPERFLNAGVAEQNMTGLAAGLASEGYHVFTYSIANFPTLRCLEQIRNDVCYHNLPVTIAAVGGGLAYGNLGYSHHAVQDIAIMRSLPEMAVFSPADPSETRECVQWLAANPQPSYLRMGKAGEQQLHTVRGIHRGPLLIRDGAEIALVSTGSILKVAIEVAVRLEAKNIGAAVFSCPWLAPVTNEFLSQLVGFRRLFVIEEHLITGGLSAILREALGAVELVSFCVQASRLREVGSQEYLRARSGLTVDNITNRIMECCERGDVLRTLY